MNELIKIIEQFSIWQVELESNPVGHEQGKSRPFLVISTTSFNHNSQTPIGFILSTSSKKAKNKYAVNIESMPEELSHVNISQIRTIDISRFKRKIGVISEQKGRETIEKFVSVIT